MAEEAIVTELVVEVQSTSVLVADASTPEVVVIEAQPEVTVVSVSEQGPPGPPGLSAEEAGSYVHQQLAPSENWIINHNLGFMPDVALFSVGGAEIEGEVVHISINLVSASFVIPVAGSARCH